MEEKEIRIEDIFYIIVRRWTVVVAIVVGFVVLAYGYSNQTTSDEVYYVSYASMVITSRTYVIVGGEEHLYDANNPLLSQKMTNTYRVIILSNNVLGKVKEDLQLEFPVRVIRGWITVTTPQDTEVLQVSVKNEDPYLAASIANSIMKVAPDVIRSTVEVGSINVLDYAEVSMEPYVQRARYSLNIAIALVLGLMSGVFLLLVNNYLRPVVKTKEDVVDVLGTLCLGEIPSINKRGSSLTNRILITDDEIDPFYFNQIKSLTAKVLSHTAKNEIKTLFITSTAPEEGKTTMSINLALSLANAGKKTLLIDLDSHMSEVVKYFDFYSEDKGSLLEIINKKIDYKDALHTHKGSGLDIIFSKINDAVDISNISPDKIRDFMDNARNDYDYVIFDTPPILVKSDTMFWVDKCDGVILVVKQEKETIRKVVETKEEIIDAGGRLVGVVLNDIKHSYGTGISRDYVYNNKYNRPYNKSRMSKYNKSRIKKDKKGLWEKTLFSLLFLLIIGIIVFFSTRTGEQIVEMNNQMLTTVFKYAENYGIIEEKLSLFAGNSGEEIGYSTEVKLMAKSFEHWIHTILFSIYTLIILNLLHAYGVRKRYMAITALVAALFLAIGNEYYQTFRVEGRGYEFIDVFFSSVGIILSLASFLIYQYLKKAGFVIIGASKSNKRSAHSRSKEEAL